MAQDLQVGSGGQHRFDCRDAGSVGMLEDHDIGVALPSNGDPIPAGVVGDVDIRLRSQNVGDDLAHHAAHVDDNDRMLRKASSQVVCR